MRTRVSIVMASSQQYVCCVGCGEDITLRKSDRRNLVTDSASHVFKEWKFRMGIELRKRVVGEASVGKIIEEVVNRHRMCRGCFSKYDRLQKFQSGIDKNIVDALDALMPLHEYDINVRAKKRPAMPDSDDCERPPSKVTPSPVVCSNSTAKSPIVSVSI